MRNRTRRPAAALVTALVVASVVLAGGVGVGAGAAATGAQEDDPDDGSSGNATDLPTADEAYLTDDGNVMLVYTDSPAAGAGDGSRTQVEFGLDVGTGLFHALTTVERTDGGAVTGEGTALLTPDGLTGNGSLTAPRPNAVRSLSLSASGSTTAENAAADASLSARLDDRNATATGALRSASLSGEFRVAPDSFRARTNLDAETTVPLGDPQRRAITLVEREDGYTLTASENYTLSPLVADRWATRERAVQRIKSQYGSIAGTLGGSADVTVSAYEYVNRTQGARLAINYTVTYEGIDEGLARQVEAQLLASEQYDLTESEAERIAGAVANLTVERARATVDQSGGSVSGSLALDLSNYAGVIEAATVLADSVEAPGAAGVNASTARIRDALAARQAAGLVQTYTLSVDVTQPERGTTAIEGSFAYRTDNWAAYVDELRARGIRTGTTSYEITAETRDDRIVARAQIELARDRLIQSAVDQALNASRGSADPEVRRLLAAFRESGFRIARLDVSATDERVRVEAGAAFRDMTALRDALQETGTAPAVTSLVGRTNDEGRVETYVRVGGVGRNASEERVRELDPVGEKTDVFLPGEYDRSFPTPDVDRARDYLGVTPTPTPSPSPGGDGEGGSGETTETSQSGLGLGVLLVALVLLVAALAAAAPGRRGDGGEE